MKLPKSKTILKYALIAAVIYTAYKTPRKDWDRNKIVEEKDKNGTIQRYAPNQSSYVKYCIAWWKNKTATVGITGIMDEYILKPLGLLDEQEKN